MSKTNGGPAFPSVPDRNYDLSSGEVILTMHYGMTLRDYFAAAALTGLLTLSQNDDLGNMEVGDWASDAYAMADAMLAERDK